MTTPRSSTNTIIFALRILSREIQSSDGVANGAIAEAADRMEEMKAELNRLRDIVGYDQVKLIDDVLR